MLYNLFGKNDAYIVEAENLKKQLNYLVRAIVNAQAASDDDIRESIAKEHSIAEEHISAVRSAVKNHSIIKQVLHKANIMRNDKALLRFMAGKSVFRANFDAKGLIAALNYARVGESYGNQLILDYQQDRQWTIHSRLDRNTRNSNKIKKSLLALASVAFLLTFVSYIVFLILATTLANPAVSVAVGNILLKVLYYTGLASAGAACIVFAVTPAWNGASSRLDRWSTSRLVKNYSESFGEDSIEPDVWDTVKNLINKKYHEVKDDIEKQLVTSVQNLS